MTHFLEPRLRRHLAWRAKKTVFYAIFLTVARDWRETMAGTIPLIRSGALVPFLRWMQANGRPIEARLRAVDLGYFPHESPDLPIPLMPVIAFAAAASREDGADLPCRVVSAASVQDLGPIGRLALGAGTVREALVRVATALPHHVTHDVITVRPVAGGVLVRAAMPLRIDGETRNFVQQYVAALLQALCLHSGAALPVFERVALVPHPIHGLEHLRPWFGGSIEPSRDGGLEILIPARVADRQLRAGVPERPAARGGAMPSPLRGDGSLAASARVVVGAMLADGQPTVERLAAAAGVSVRTLQRRLGEEGTSFSRLLEAVRRDLALAGLAKGGLTAGEVASALGYAQQSSLTRAVRRWTGSSPRRMAGKCGDPSVK
jgi:AraC-like DNA-binding protein